MKCFKSEYAKTKQTVSEPPDEEPFLCEICGKPIQPTKKLSVQGIIAISQESVGKQACWECFGNEYLKTESEKAEHNNVEPLHGEAHGKVLS